MKFKIKNQIYSRGSYFLFCCRKMNEFLFHTQYHLKINSPRFFSSLPFQGVYYRGKGVCSPIVPLFSKECSAEGRGYPLQLFPYSSKECTTEGRGYPLQLYPCSPRSVVQREGGNLSNCSPVLQGVECKGKGVSSPIVSLFSKDCSVEGRGYHLQLFPC